MLLYKIRGSYRLIIKDASDYRVIQRIYIYEIIQYNENVRREINWSINESNDKDYYTATLFNINTFTEMKMYRYYFYTIGRFVLSICVRKLFR